MGLDELRRLLADLSDTEVAFLVADRPLSAPLVRLVLRRFAEQRLPRLDDGEGGAAVVVLVVL